MKFIAYSDPHVHPHQSYSKALPDGMNSRLKDILDAVREIYSAANRLKIPVVCGGDLFQVKNSMHVIAYNEMSKILTDRAAVADPYNPDIICVGNHDIASHDGKRHALEPFLDTIGIAIPPADGYHFRKSPTGTLFTAISYPMEHGRFSEEKFRAILGEVKTHVIASKSKTSVLISHLYTHELMKKHLNLAGDFPAAELLDVFDLVLLGHHHVHDVITGPTDAKGRVKKVISIGSPIQLRSDEKGEKKGYLIVDTDTLEFEFVPLESPEFHLFDGEKTIIPEKIKGDFVTVKVKSKAEAARVETLLKRAEVAEFRIEITPTAKTSRIDLSAGAEDEEILDKFLKSEWGKTSLDPARLTKLGMSYLK